MIKSGCRLLISNLAIISFFSIFFSCNRDRDEEYLSGEILFYEDNLQLDSLTGEQVKLDDIYSGRMDVCDSLVFIQYFRYPDYFVSVFNHYNGKHLGNYLLKGNGPNEFIDLSWIYQFFEENGHLKGLMYTFFKERVVIWDITESLNTGVSHSTLIDISKNEPRGALGGYMFFTEQKKIVANVKDYESLDERSRIPNNTYHIIDCETNEIIQVYYLYNKLFDNENKSLKDEFYFPLVSHNVEGTKIAYAMRLLHQINILDIITGEQKGFRLKHTPGFRYFATQHDKVKFYYMAITADTKYIYALYSGETKNLNETPIGRIIQIFDWNGDFIRKVYLDRGGNHIGIDAMNGALLVKDDTTDEIYRYYLKNK